ncbi:MAG: hypothetical protein FWG90_07950 [Oscillospiraceae bacterium]|nr:hypothetical protein [Oscillospiraceae bacterium]
MWIVLIIIAILIIPIIKKCIKKERRDILSYQRRVGIIDEASYFKQMNELNYDYADTENESIAPFIWGLLGSALMFLWTFGTMSLYDIFLVGPSLWFWIITIFNIAIIAVGALGAIKRKKKLFKVAIVMVIIEIGLIIYRYYGSSYLLLSFIRSYGFFHLISMICFINAARRAIK